MEGLKSSTEYDFENMLYWCEWCKVYKEFFYITIPNYGPQKITLKRAVCDFCRMGYRLEYLERIEKNHPAVKNEN